MPKSEPVSDADQLRSPESASLPDRRSDSFARIRADGAISKTTLQDRYDDIREFVLNDAVPHAVRVHFETAMNLYLYTWFVYRFFPVAEQYALTTLEFAFCERLKPLFPKMFGKDGNRSPGLRTLLDKARAKGLIANEGMRSYERRALLRARDRVSFEKIREMERHGLSMIQYDESDIKPIPEDYVHDSLQVLSEGLPLIRNDYAHGSTALHSTIHGTFEIVTDLVNQLFPPLASGKPEET